MEHELKTYARGLSVFQDAKMVNLNEMQLKINDSFVFRRFEKIDWKQIASLNMEQLKVGTDWNIIEKNLCNILCCHLESEFKQSDLDPNVCKLFQLAQVSIEYLLQMRHQILAELQSCQEKMQTSQSALSEAIKAKEQVEKKLKELKKESKKATNQQHYYRCPACPKTFFNGEFLHGHWQRRHPEYVAISTLVPAKTSPIQPSTPIKETCPPVPPVSLPIKTNDTPAAPCQTQNFEMSKLKERLQLAETQLQKEQQLLYSVTEKMEKSNVNLQGMLAREVEKICATLREEKIEQLVIPAAAEAPYSPQKCFQSSSVQTTPRMFYQLETSSPQQSNVTDKTIIQDVITIPTPTVRSVYKQESMNLTRISPPKEDESLSHSSPPSSITENSSEDEQPRIEVKTVEKKKLAKVNRQFLMDRFKKTIENALEKRMQSLGIDINRKTLSTSTFRQLSEKLNSNQTADYIQMRNQFESQLKDRLKNIKSPIKSHKKPLKPLLTMASNRHKRSEMERAATTVRAPVPTPRSRNQITEPPPSLMARDGESYSVPSSDVKETTAHLEHQVNDRVLIRPPAEDTIPKAMAKEPEKVDTEEDSFSFSSLDAILTELKKPNRSNSQTPPSTMKSVQWRVPVETVEKPVDDSWDSP